MEEKKLTDEEIVKALEFCAKDSSCLWDSKCPLRNDKDCHVTLSREALDLIHRLQGENKQLKCDSYRTSWKAKFLEAKKEIERLTEELKYYRGELQ